MARKLFTHIPGSKTFMEQEFGCEITSVLSVEINPYGYKNCSPRTSGNILKHIHVILNTKHTILKKITHSDHSDLIKFINAIKVSVTIFSFKTDFKYI